jgi:hypothetical protein
MSLNETGQKKETNKWIIWQRTDRPDKVIISILIFNLNCHYYSLQSRESRKFFGAGIAGLKLPQHRDVGTNILFIS